MLKTAALLWITAAPGLPDADLPALELPAALGFLSGCWQGKIGNGAVVEEQYSSLHGGILLGYVKTVAADDVFFEWLRIYRDADGVWLQAYPHGEKTAVRFALSELKADKAVFENPNHDFPRRISYRLLPNDILLTQVAGIINSGPVFDEYRTNRSACQQ